MNKMIIIGMYTKVFLRTMASANMIGTGVGCHGVTNFGFVTMKTTILDEVYSRVRIYSTFELDINLGFHTVGLTA